MLIASLVPTLAPLPNHFRYIVAGEENNDGNGNNNDEDKTDPSVEYIVTTDSTNWSTTVGTETVSTKSTKVVPTKFNYNSVKKAPIWQKK